MMCPPPVRRSMPSRLSVRTVRVPPAASRPPCIRRCLKLRCVSATCAPPWPSPGPDFRFAKELLRSPWLNYHSRETPSMRNEILAALPELNLIQDAGLRDQVIAVWQESLQTGGFSIEEMKQVPFALLGDQASITLLERVRAVCRTCVAIADSLSASYGKRVSINRDFLVAGALL